MADEWFVFVDPDGVEHRDGHIEFRWTEWHEAYAGETLGGMCLESMSDIGPILDYVKSQFPDGWRIEGGKVVPGLRGKKEAEHGDKVE